MFATGNNEVPSEDALVLHLQLSKSQEKLVEALKGQQNEIKELQSLLSEQQGMLVNQQREILDQQRRMYDQMEQVRLLRLIVREICTFVCLSSQKTPSQLKFY